MASSDPSGQMAYDPTAQLGTDPTATDPTALAAAYPSQPGPEVNSPNVIIYSKGKKLIPSQFGTKDGDVCRTIFAIIWDQDGEPSGCYDIQASVSYLSAFPEIMLNHTCRIVRKPT